MSSTTPEIETTTTEEPTMIASAAPLTTPTTYREIATADRDTLLALATRRTIAGRFAKPDDELRYLVALAYGLTVPKPAAGEVVEVEEVEVPLQVEIDESDGEVEIEIADTRPAYGDGEVEDDDGDDEPVEVEEVEETTPEKPRKAPRKSRRLSPEVKAARAAERALKREQARVERENRKAEKRQQREALAAERKAVREAKAKAKTDRAVETLTNTVIAPTDDYKVRSSGVMKAAHAIARLAVDAGSANPYRREMGSAMKALWGRLKAGEVILGGDYLPAVDGAVEATVEPVEVIDEIDAITTPENFDDDDDLEGDDLYSLIPAA